MKKKLQQYWYVALFLAFSLPFLTGISYWGAGSPVKTYFDTLTITVADGRDSTAIWPVHKNMTLTLVPGITTTDPDSFVANVAATSDDSTIVDIIVRYWNDKSRTVCMGNRVLIDEFQMKIAAVTTNFDSATVAFGLVNPNVTALTAGTGSWDSTLIYLNTLRDYGYHQATAPYFDILAYDDGTETAKGAAYKVQITYSDY